MKKKYIQYRSGLFIGLLSLSTLSSCVNTRSELDMGPWNSKVRDSRDNNNMENGRGSGSSKNSSTWSSTVKNVAYATGGVVTGATVGALTTYARMSSNCSSPNGSPGSNPAGWNETSPWGSGRP